MSNQDQGSAPNDRNIHADISALASFSAPVRDWFARAFAAPTEVQAQAWRTINAGDNALIVAPTGSGKTLSAFLSAIDALTREPATSCQVIYVSPLKALAADIERNLAQPLDGIDTASDITVAVRTADTTTAERRTFASKGANILITTPESLFLLLTSAARDRLRDVRTVIVDEIHAIAATKRGAHLSLSLERLDALTSRPVQRIGLSATAHPISEVARLLGGAAPVTVVAPRTPKTLRVHVPTPALGQGSTWPELEQTIFQQISAATSTIVFVNSRRVAERLTARLNEIATENPAPPTSGAQVQGQSGTAAGAAPTLAKAHHGSMSPLARRDVENALKAGELAAVVATSSLELGIDMGAVDLVIQVGAPETVASGLQRVGRAGHQVFAESTGIIYPQHHADVLRAASVAELMLAGDLEPVRVPLNPLDVLTQQVAAAVSMDNWHLSELTALIRRAAPYRHLSDDALHSVLDLLSGRYPSDDLAQLAPKIVWDRVEDLLTTRPGTQRAVIAAAGTIPDRGLYGVFLADGEGRRRVGELDEEMVYESRVGDVILLGSTSWHITEITDQHVLVAPAAGRAARLPFWKADAITRSRHLAYAIGELTRAIRTQPPDVLRPRLAAAGLTPAASDALLEYVRSQGQDATPDDRTIVVERFRDELGDWRLVIHSLFGGKVNGAWALALRNRLTKRFAFDPQVLHSDDGIIIRLPEGDNVRSTDWATLIAVDPAELESLVTSELAGSALFAARFRECAARAMLMPRRYGKRVPLWLQRQRATQLLSATSNYPSFPIVVEALRECLTDVFDIDGARGVLTDVASGAIAIRSHLAAAPTPFARGIMFTHLGEFVYDGDTGLAEHRSALLAIDPSLLAELIGPTQLRELLDPDVVASSTAQAQRLTSPLVSDVEGTADLLRVVGPLTISQAAARGADESWLEELVSAGRATVATFAGEPHWLAVEDAARVRDGLGVAIDNALPTVWLRPVAEPLADLFKRYARTHGPFTTTECAAEFGLATTVVDDELSRLANAGYLVAGEFTPGTSGQQWCDAEMLRRLRQRSLAALRREIAPVSASAYTRFAMNWGRHEGPDALLAAIGDLAGYPLPLSRLDFILARRAAGYQPGRLDDVISSGEVIWAGAGPRRIRLAPADTADHVLAPPDPLPESREYQQHRAVLELLATGGARFSREIAKTLDDDQRTISDVLWDLAWRGYVTNDSLAAARAWRPTPTSPASAANRRARRRVALPTPASIVAGRWWMVPAVTVDATARAHTWAHTLLARYGIVTADAALSEDHRVAAGGFAGTYPVLTALEAAGAIRRGYFVAGLGGSQFASPRAVEMLRDARRADDYAPGVVAACDPANPFGSVLPWPDHVNRPTRSATGLVVTIGGDFAAFWDAGRLVLHRDDPGPILRALAGTGLQIAIDEIDGEPALGTPLAALLREAGFRATPKGFRRDATVTL